MFILDNYMIVIIACFVLLPLLFGKRILQLFKKPVIDDMYWFDDFICNDFFKEDHYVVKPLSDRPGEIIPDENLLPDFRFVQIHTGYEFFIKTKYVIEKVPDKLNWCEQSQFLNYKFIKDIPLFIIIGTGGTASLPKCIYVIPFQYFTSHTIHLMDLTKYRVNKADDINFQQ